MIPAWLLHRALTPESKLVYEHNRLLEEAPRVGIDLKPVPVEAVDFVTGERQVFINGTPSTAPLFALTRVKAAQNYRNLAVVRELESQGTLCVNSSQAILQATDKLHTLQICSQYGIPVVPTLLSQFPPNMAVLAKMGWPIIAKTVDGSLGDGVYLCQNELDFQYFLRVFKSTRSERLLILQPYLRASNNQDLRVIVVGGKVVACARRTAPQGDFRANVHQGGTMSPEPLTPEVEQIAIQTTHALGLSICGVDLLHDGQKWVVCEANSSVGFKGVEAACRINVAHAILIGIKHLLSVREGHLNPPELARAS